jgi:hypothetical protein
MNRVDTLVKKFTESLNYMLYKDRQKSQQQFDDDMRKYYPKNYYETQPNTKTTRVR